ncbi:adenylate kinase [Marinicella gelatinilytica]|uniref:adenylate kinase n=1 Tax=Marinicella gelatinilytica TaxID=2996017 RepID=UPI002260BE73|nr:adenylate kinase [Marinicella gelatinilytica]MCX7545598.1 adenylate kinase [Marinicella gelatinilytica]
MRIVLLGAPGSGKGTQAKLIVKERQIPHISTGDLLRGAIADQTELGLAAKKVMDAGELVSDEIVLGMLKDRLNQPDAAKGFVLDGFPRNVRQAEMLEELLSELDIQLDHALLIQVNPDEVVARIAKRAQEEGRTDDTEEVVRNRLEVYREQTEPVADFYRKQDIVSEIHGTGSIEEVHDRIQAVFRF